MINHLTQKAESALNLAMEYAREMGHTYIGSEHLLLGLCTTEDSIASRLMEERGVKSSLLRDAIIKITGVGTRSSVTPSDMTPRVQKIIEGSAIEAMKNGQCRVGTEHLLMSLLNEGSGVALHLLEDIGISFEELRADVGKFLSASGKAQSSTRPNKDTMRGALEIKSNAKPTALQSYTRDLTAQAESGKIDPMIGRDEEIARVVQILSRRTKNNPCLIGEPGVGKTAVVEGLASLIISDHVPKQLRHAKLMSLDIPSMLAGAKYRGEFEERLKQIIAEVSGRQDVILFIDEIHTLVGAGAAEGAIDAANILKPALARGELQLIGATTQNEYRKYIEKDAALERRFQPVRIAPPTPEECILILHGLKEKYESFHGILISDEAIESAVTLSVRYIPDRFLPDKAIDLIDEGCAALKIRAKEESEALRDCRHALRITEEEKEQAILRQDFEEAAHLRDQCEALRKQEQKIITKDKQEFTSHTPTLLPAHIAQIVTRQTGIPVFLSASEENQKLLTLEERLEKVIVGQKEAIHTLADAIRRNRTGMRNPDRPIGCFLFAGPSGVGKTELCRVLAKELFDTETALIRLDMSEYMERHSVSRLIGSPPGYVGFEEGGQLTERVRRCPYSVVLFDEIEKAHGDVYHILLQIMEDGILTDSSGRHIDFKNTILIMTSNVGEEVVGSAHRTGFSSASGEQAIQQKKEDQRRKILRTTFRPEFLNRLDAVVYFTPLDRENLLQIASLMMEKTARNLSTQGITLKIDQTAKQALCDIVCEEQAGARPLRRMITEHVENMLASKVLSGELRKGSVATVFFQDLHFQCQIENNDEAT